MIEPQATPGLLIRRAERIARDQLDFDHLRPAQREAIVSIVDGRDTLVVMPTGSGKSAIYQLAGCLLDGPTVVVSPLIALQQDQVEAIAEAGIGEAARINATLSDGERRDTLDAVEQGEIDFIFLAPEQLANEETLAQVAGAQPVLVVVDEAHCISEWGHDFRPAYLRLGPAIEALGRPVVLAMTATASPPVRAEIIQGLGLRDPAVQAHGFDRPNISLAVEWVEDDDDKRARIIARVRETPGPGIIYAATRARAEAMADALREAGVRAGFYHGGMTKTERTAAQDAFMGDAVDVMVATTAFGMGIDKPNVRFVYHHDISDSVDAYYQEIGRAGRDGEPAQAILFYHPDDLSLRRFFASGGSLDPDEMEALLTTIKKRRGPVDPRALQKTLDLSDSRLLRMLNRLGEVGAVALLPSGEVEATVAPREIAEKAEEAAEAQKSHQHYAQTRVDMIRRYAETTDCRREYLLNYFGEAFDPPCGACDNCLSGREAAREEVRDHPFPLNARVEHASWGPGLVMRHEDADRFVVLFDQVGYRTLSLEIVQEGNLLKLADEA